MSCKELVELVTDYLEDTLPADERRRFEEHLTICPGCVVHVDQMRATVHAVGVLREDDVTPEARDALLNLFRDWQRG